MIEIWRERTGSLLDLDGRRRGLYGPDARTTVADVVIVTDFVIE